jgi:hypothetical protein
MGLGGYRVTGAREGYECFDAGNATYEPGRHRCLDRVRLLRHLDFF